jgi:hypothetical protein
MLAPLCTVNGMRLVESQPRRDGSRIVATFEAIFPTFKLAGCLVVIDAAGEVKSFPPEARSRTRDLPPVTITDYALLRAMRRKAFRAFNVLVDQGDDHDDDSDDGLPSTREN